MSLRLFQNGLGRGRTIENPQSLPSESIQDPFDLGEDVGKDPFDSNVEES